MFDDVMRTAFGWLLAEDVTFAALIGVRGGTARTTKRPMRRCLMETRRDPSRARQNTRAAGERHAGAHRVPIALSGFTYSIARQPL